MKWYHEAKTNIENIETLLLKTRDKTLAQREINKLKIGDKTRTQLLFLLNHFSHVK